jgi:hypothetical protein
MAINHKIPALGLLALLATSCSKADKVDGDAPSAASPFTSVEATATAGDTFSGPRSGVPLPGGGVAFVASVPATEDEAAHAGLFRSVDGETTLLYAGALLQNPLDLDLALDGSTLFVADSIYVDDLGEAAGGAILSFPVEGGEPTANAIGYAPRAVTVAESGDVYFSGRDRDSGQPGVFRLAGDSAQTLYSGAPLVDPSGLAVFEDGQVLVADTRAQEDASTNATRGAVIAIADGEARLFASGFETGYPAGIALSADESKLIISGQGADSTNLVYVLDAHDPSAEAYVETGFAAQSWSSGGLHRAHGESTFAWCDRAAAGGTIYTISAR